VSPNPPVGAVIVRDGRTLGEGFHHMAGEAHAEVEALRAAGEVAAATLYVTLEPCNHHGRTPPCTDAIVASGIERVVIGAADPNPATDGAGIARLRAAGMQVDVVNERRSVALIERFAAAIRLPRPYVTLKMASSVDGYVAPRPGPHWLTGEPARLYVRELRAEHDAVLVGAGTIRVDDPQLTTRPHFARRKPYVRVVACETDPVEKTSRIFTVPTPPGAFVASIVLAPRGAARRFEALESVADVLYVGDEDSTQLDLPAALRALKSERGIASVLCEGGPTLAGRLLSAGLVDRLTMLVAPALLGGEQAVPVFAGADLRAVQLRFDRHERIGDDLLISAKVEHV
jgi:diaminohydroxyphosphoribosylaminopyrimidine deaminase/5-amino-6-(5-phosphoribosylamino)uracil reductase